MKTLARALLVLLAGFVSATLLAAQTVGVLRGSVVSAAGKPVAGARVLIQTADGRRPFTVRTDAEGKFRVPRISRGLYHLRAQSGGLWSDWEHNVLVRAGQPTSVTLRLALKQPPAAAAAKPAPLTGRVREWNVPLEGGFPHDPATDPSGNVWLTLQRGNQIARLNPESGEWKLFPVPTANSGPHGLVSDAEGNIWFTENSVGKIGRVDARTGVITEFAAPTAKDPHTPVFGPDGALWFTAQRSNLVVRMDTRTGAMKEYTVPTPNARPYGIVPAPDGGLWFCEFNTNKLGRIDPTTGAFTEIELPSTDARPRRLAVSGNAVYYTDFRGGRLGRLDLETRAIQEWLSPSGPASQPYGIEADGSGVIWYNEFAANQLVRFDPRTQAFERFLLPSARSEVRHMARDSRGRVWMALSGANKAAVVE